MSRVLIILCNLLWLTVLPAWTEHGPNQHPCRELPRLTTEVAHLDSLPPEIPDGLSPEDQVIATAKWEAWRDAQRANLAKLKKTCGVAE